MDGWMGFGGCRGGLGRHDGAEWGGRGQSDLTYLITYSAKRIKTRFFYKENKG